MSEFFNIIKEEYKKLFTDFGAILIMVIGVFMYSIFYALPYYGEVLRDVPVGVVDFDYSQASRKLIRFLDANENINITKHFSDVESAKIDFDKGKINAYVVIPNNFEKDVLRSKPVHIALYSDSAYFLTYRQMASSVITTAKILGVGIELEKYKKKGVGNSTSLVLPFDFVQVSLFNPSGGYLSYVYPAVLILILQQTLLVGLGLLYGTSRENNEKCISKNIPICIFARSTAHVLLYLFHSIFYFIILPLLLNYPLNCKEPFLCLFFLIIYFYTISFLAQTLIYFFKNRETSLMLLVVTSLPMAFLAGYIWPKECMPIWLNFVAQFIPSTSAITIFTRLNQMGASFFDVLNPIFVLFVLFILYFITACYTSKKIYK